MKGQSRLMSAVEVKSNLVIGFFLAWGVNAWITPRLFGIRMDGRQAFGVTALFTIISFVRQYVCRRVFNQIQIRKEQNGNLVAVKDQAEQ